MTERQLRIGAALMGDIEGATIRELLTDDDRTQQFADNATAPGGRDWEAQCSRQRITYLQAIVRFNLQELEREQARLAHLEGGADDECA